MNTKKVYTSIATATLLSIALAIPAFAQTPTPQGVPGGQWGQGRPAMGVRGGFGGAGGMRKMGPSVVGTVSVISGDSMTLSGRSGFGTSTPATTFTIDATNATVEKNNATSSVSSIAVGDTLFVQGTISGSNVTATNIRDGVMPGRGMMNGKRGPDASSTQAQIQGDGQPIIGGTISAISGNTLTITNKSNVTYTVDATNAKILSGNQNSTLANVKIGDNVVVQGAVNGTSITATSVIDQAQPTAAKKPIVARFFGAIGGFFGHLFGF